MGRTTWTDEQLIESAKISISKAELLRNLGLKPHGNNFTLVNKRIKELNINIQHFKGRGHGKSNEFLTPRKKIPLEQILVENSTYTNRGCLKKRIVEAGIVENKCAICGLKNEWLGKPLMLRIDHIDGNSINNTKENLRLLCPNCDSQTDTFCGRNVKAVFQHKICKYCGNRIDNRSKTGYCYRCTQKHRTGEVNQYTTTHSRKKHHKLDNFDTIKNIKNRPSYEELKELLIRNSLIQIGKIFGVSYAAIKKWIKKENLYEHYKENSKWYNDIRKKGNYEFLEQLPNKKMCQGGVTVAAGDL
jgi:hypothetical protein